MEPDVATAPIPTLIEAEVASVEVHVSVEDCPAVIVDGPDDMDTVGAGTAGIVMTLAYNDQ